MFGQGTNDHDRAIAHGTGSGSNPDGEWSLSTLGSITYSFARPAMKISIQGDEHGQSNQHHSPSPRNRGR